MPTYEHECTKCNKIIEAEYKITDYKLIKCTYCNNETKRIISNNSFRLKGGGWTYKKDYYGEGLD